MDNEPQHEIRYSVTDVTVPEAAKPGSLLAVRFQQNHTLNIDGDWVFYVVPEKCVAGSCFDSSAIPSRSHCSGSWYIVRFGAIPSLRRLTSRFL